MERRTGKANMLYELAQATAASGDRAVATALRRLAQAGYDNLSEVDGVSDWTLLSISGIGVERLRAVRQLTRPDWQPPSSLAIKAAGRFLSAVQFALRFWLPETLASMIAGSVPQVAEDRPHESHWAIELFSSAVSEALQYSLPEELIGILDAESSKSGQRPASP